MERFENGSDVSGFRSLNNSTSKKVLNLLEPVKLTVWKVMIERVTVEAYIVFTFLDCFRIKSGKPQPILTKVSTHFFVCSPNLAMTHESWLKRRFWTEIYEKFPFRGHLPPNPKT